MEKAKILFIEDNKDVQTLGEFALYGTEHEIVAGATTLPDALEQLERVVQGQLDVNVFLLDGNMTASHHNGEDAQFLSNLIKKKKLSGHIIGFSAQHMPEEDFPYEQVKNKNFNGLLQILDNLSEIDRHQHS